MTLKNIIRSKFFSHLGVYFAGLIGMVFIIILVLHEGAGGVMGCLEVAGWGLLWLVPFHLLPIGLDATGWRRLLRDERRATLPFLVWVAGIRESINGLLPVARIGGELAGIRLLFRRGIPGDVAGASIMVEVTLNLVSQFMFALMGVGIMVHYVGKSAIIIPMLLGCLIAFPGLVIFILLQRQWGFFQLLKRLIKVVLGNQNPLKGFVDPACLDDRIHDMYRCHSSLGITLFWQMTGLFMGAAEVWLTFYLLGEPIKPWMAMLLESLGQALRSASFFMPAGLGIQEGGFVFLGSAIGIGPNIALAFSFARRFRELAFGIPFLLSWQSVEGHHLHRNWRNNSKKIGSPSKKEGA
ncbi:MAG TPA: lysylphosphatidylglycerol synthase domain-containing protein [Burkholderiales bacterium]|nr:lysylphosphatidylglycerol synthase domain-containing protein [Burkholderiales bacterium]